MAVLNSQLRLTLFDNVTARARGMMGTLQRMQGMARRTNAAMAMPMGGGLLGGLARTAAPFVGIYAMGRALTSTTGNAADFETAMNRVNVLTGATATEFAALSAQARELGASTQFKASEAADAMGFLGMAGFKANEIMGAMPGTLQLAAAAQMDLAASADLVSNVLTGYNKDVSELGHVNDVLVKAFTSANTDLAQLGQAMKYAGPVAQAAGVRFEETAAAIALMGNAGIQGTMAGTSVRGAISRMLTPTTKMRTAMHSAGLQFTNTEGRLLPLVDIIRQLEPHAEDAGLFMELFGQRAGPAMAALVSQGGDALVNLDRDLVSSKGTAERVASAQMVGLNGQMRRFWSAVEAVQISIGSRINPGIESMFAGMTGGLSDLVGFIDSLDGRITVIDKISAAFNGLAVGLSGGGGAGFLDLLREIRDFMVSGIFGDTASFEADANNLAAISNTFRRMGRNFRAFTDDLFSGDFRGAVTNLSAAFREMNGWGTFSAVFLGARALQLLAAATWAIAKSPLGQLLVAASAVATLIDAFKGADSMTQFVDNLTKLSTFEYVALAAGLALIGAKVWTIARGLRAVGAAGGLGAAVRLPGAPGGGAPMSPLGFKVPKVGPTSSIGPGFSLRGIGLRGIAGGLGAGLAYEGGKWGINSGLDALDGALGIDPARKEQVDTSTGGILQRLFGGGNAPKIDLSSESLSTLLKPGDQVDANIVNPPQRPNVTVGPFTINMQSGESPEDVGRRIGAEAAAVVGGSFMDGGL